MASSIYDDIDNEVTILSQEECLKKLADMQSKAIVELFKQLDLGNITQTELNESIDAARQAYEAKVKEVKTYYEDNGEPSGNDSSFNDTDKKESTSTSQKSSYKKTYKKSYKKKTTKNKEVSMTDSSEYIATYSSFSGCDMVAIFELPISSKKAISKVVGTLQSVTYSIHNEKIPVRCLGDMNMKNCVFGGRIIAGTMVFTVFNRHWLRDLIKEYLNTMGYADVHYLSDEIPPLNVTFTMANEYGQNARLALYGVTFVNEGQVLSINDNYTENTFEYYAKDLDYFGAVATSSSKKNNKQSNTDVLQTLSNGNTDATGNAVDSPKNTDADLDNLSGIENESIVPDEIADMIKAAYNDIDQSLKTSSQEDIIKQLGKIQYDITFNSLMTKKDSGELTSTEIDEYISYSRKVYEVKLKNIQKYYAAKETSAGKESSKGEEAKE